MSHKTTSNFAGFIDGYKARNMAVSASSVAYLFEEMGSVVEQIIKSQGINASPEITQLLERLGKLLSTRYEDVLPAAISCGEILKTILMISKQNGDPSGLLADEKMKRIVYHYLEFAEISDDSTVGDLAISIGSFLI